MTSHTVAANGSRNADGRCVLVTGANRGLGRQVCELLAEQGWFVLVGCRRAAAGQDTVAALRAAGGAADWVVLDVADAGSIREAAVRIGELTGRLDALVNNAGVFLPADEHLSELTVDTCMTTLFTNTVGPLFVIHELLPLLRSAGSASVVNVSSEDAKPERVTGAYTCYRMSKAALNVMTANLAVATKPDRIVVNAVEPGWIPTDMGGPAAPDDLDTAAALVVWATGLAATPEPPTGELFSVRALPPALVRPAQPTPAGTVRIP